ncbi:helix-turn-helix domain-containing protein [Mucilaginibacter roseus]|uniref:Helix-turn-helix domain-containing protein n=1 Tax=Mucilaginibacter roseus TaxID=1528868 RepID=A0ABS8U0F2_9SPHI|nr:helix-turn-helix domain-containing protein [Mucilaginibacter roseus]MCD8739021.1 helix-turn-helix domain-containing protein [Mucilaginibacter roseus]
MKGTVPVYDFADFPNDTDAQMEGHIDGLSVHINMSNVEEEMTKRQFRSNFFLISLVVRGEMNVNINLTEYQVQKYGMVLIAPNDLKQAGSLNAENSGMISTLAFSADFLSKAGLSLHSYLLLAPFSSQYSPLWELKPTDFKLIYNLFKQIAKRCDEIGDHPYGMELVITTFSMLLYEMAGLSKKYALQINVIFTRKENLVTNFATLVQQQFRNERSVKYYAEQLNISAKYLTETVKEISGKTAGEVIDSYVLQEAIALLDDPALSILEISDYLNFYDQSSFGKFFKRHKGLSPKSHRQT